MRPEQSPGGFSPAPSLESVRPLPAASSYPADGAQATPCQAPSTWGHRGRLVRVQPAQIRLQTLRTVGVRICEYSIIKKIEHFGRPMTATELTHSAAPGLGFLHELLAKDRDGILGSMIDRGLLVAESRQIPHHYGSTRMIETVFYGLPPGGDE